MPLKPIFFSALTLFVTLFILTLTSPLSANRGVVKRAKDLNHSSGRLGTYKALIIGIDNYRDPQIPDLETAANDARSVSRLLKEEYGFSTRLLLNGEATKGAIYQALRKLTSGSREEDSILIYYAGHGDLDQVYHDGWWIPADAKGGDPLTYLDNNQILKAMRNMIARHVLLISDSCYSGTLFGSARSLPPVITEKYYLNLYNEKSRWGMTSGNKTPVSDSGTNGHSVFAYQLLKELRTSEKPYFTAQEIYTSIAPIIGNNAEQTPLCKPVKGAGDQGGQFVFVRVAGGSIAVDEEAVNLAHGSAGNLEVSTRPSGALIRIDGVNEGRSPLSLSDIPVGVVAVSAELDGYGSEKDKVRIRAGRNSKLTLLLDKVVLRGSLTVNPQPASARIRILNISPPYSPGMELAPGRYHLEVSAEGYATRSEWLELAADDDLRYPVRLVEKKQIITAPSVPAAGENWRDPGTGMEFVFVPGGCFQMGSTGGGSDEKPVHEVCVDGFYMGKYEVTQGQYQKIVGSNPSYFKKGRDYPVEMVYWDDAQSFIRQLSSRSGKNFRLPTEAEWEYAARSGGKRQEYAGGNSVDSVAWYGSNSGDSTHEVGTKAANGLGLYDMSGNVWEWCSDWYGKGYYSSSPRSNPQGPSSGSNRVYRGGGWGDGPGLVRSAFRDGSTPGYRNDYLGFRLAFPQGNR